MIMNKLTKRKAHRAGRKEGFLLGICFCVIPTILLLIYSPLEITIGKNQYYQPQLINAKADMCNAFIDIMGSEENIINVIKMQDKLIDIKKEGGLKNVFNNNPVDIQIIDPALVEAGLM